jgi:putative transposase
LEYLLAVLDWFSRFVVAWTLDLTLEIGFVLDGMRSALATATPTICNSDQGSPFTSPQYLALFHETAVQISMDGKGRALDNIFTERLWRTVKYEQVYLKDYASPREARTGIDDYLDFYNYWRLHQALDYQTPAQVYFKKGDESTDKFPFLLS